MNINILLRGDKMEYHICTECKIHHYENCDTCFGFGVYKNPNCTEQFPITAGVAHDLHLSPIKGALPCPECKSTLKGLPTNTR